MKTKLSDGAAEHQSGSEKYIQRRKSEIAWKCFALGDRKRSI